MKFYALIATDGSVLARFRRDTETTEEWLMVDGTWTPIDDYVSEALVEGVSNLVEVGAPA